MDKEQVEPWATGTPTRTPLQEESLEFKFDFSSYEASADSLGTFPQVLNPDTEQKFTKSGKKRPPDLVIPDEINAFKAEQWIENLRQPAEMAGLVPYTDPVKIDSPPIVRTETGKTVYYGMYIYLKKRVELLRESVDQGMGQLRSSHASYCQGMESDQREMRQLIKEVKRSSADIRRRIRDNIQANKMSK